jgi:hypothetical protein
MGRQGDLAMLKEVQSPGRSTFGEDDLAWFESDVMRIYGYAFDGRQRQTREKWVVQ